MWEINSSRRAPPGSQNPFFGQQQQQHARQDELLRSGLKSRGRLSPSERLAYEEWYKATNTDEPSALQKFVQYTGITFGVLVCFSAVAWVKP